MKNDENPNVIRLTEQKTPTHGEALRLTPHKKDVRTEGINLSLVKKIVREERREEKEEEDTRHRVRSTRTHVLTPERYRPSFGIRAAEGLIGKFAALLLIPTMLIYPILPAYAAEDASSTPPAPAETTTDSASTSGGSDGGGIVAAVTGVIENIANAINPSSPLDASSTTGTSEVTDGSTTPPVGDAAGDGSASSTATTTPTLPGDTDASSTDATTTPPLFPPPGDASSTDATSTPAEGGDDASTTPDITPTASSTDEIDSSTVETASSTESVASSTEEVNEEPPGPTNDEIIAQKLAEREESMRASIRKEVETEFTKGCVTLDTTGYYCLKEHQQESPTALTPSTAVSAVTSQLPDKGMYKQIFITRGGDAVALTNDEWDNAFPSMDITGTSVVWQGNVSGRWQIFYTDVSGTGTPRIIPLTHSTESNFNPRVDGNDVVWQGWVDGNWEIFLAEHLDVANFLDEKALPKENVSLGIDREWKVTRITSNIVHDMFPSISGELVTWQSFQDNAWNIYVYSMKTHATTKLSHSGDKSEKPRFAITWDERSPEGAARMVGYDIASGKSLDLTSEARQVNDEKPYSKQPEAPISQPNQAALPVASSTASSTSAKSDGDGPNANDLGV